MACGQDRSPTARSRRQQTNYASLYGPSAIVGEASRGRSMADRERNTPNESDEVPLTTTAEVAAVVRDVQRKRRGQIRWSLGKHTAEMALRALEGPAHPVRRGP